MAAANRTTKTNEKKIAIRRKFIVPLVFLDFHVIFP